MISRKNTTGEDRELRPWLRKMDVPEDNYLKLPTLYKKALYDAICKGKRLSPLERLEIYQKLVPAKEVALRSRERYPKVNDPTDEELEEFFKPTSPGERLPTNYKY